MQKIDYTDINKFLVSIGLILIGLSLLIPYFYLKEDFGLLLKAETFNTLTEQVKEIANHKLGLISKLQFFLPWCSGILLLLGIIALIVGLIRWFSRQSQIDKRYDLHNTKLEYEIKALTPVEEINKVRHEIEEIELSNKIETYEESTQINHILSNNPNQQILSYLKIKREIIKIYKSNSNTNLVYEIFDNQKMGMFIEIDIILKSKMHAFSDKIIEIKYFKNQIPLDILYKCLSLLKNHIYYYKEHITEKVSPVLLIVYSSDQISSKTIVKSNKILTEAKENNDAFMKFRFKFIKESEILNFDPWDLFINNTTDHH